MQIVLYTVIQRITQQTQHLIHARMRKIATLAVFLLTFASLSAFPTFDECAPDTITNNTSSSISQQKSTSLIAQIEGNILRLSNVPDGSVLHIYAITGMRIGSFTVQNNEVHLNDALPKGIYIIKVNNKATKITVR